MTQRARLLMLFLCVPIVMAGMQIHPWDLSRQLSSGSEIRNEAGKTDKPVVRASLPATFGLQREAGELHGLPNTKDPIRTGEIRESNESPRAGLAAQEASRRPLGALGATGEVYINSSPAPSQSTIFAGDTVRTGDRGLATFTMSGQGSIGMNSNTEVSFVDDPKYVAVLHRGALMIHFFTGATTRFRLRVLNYFVAGQSGTEATAEINQTREAAATVNCRSGSIAVTELQGREVSFLQAGQLLEIENVEGEAAAPQVRAPLPAPPEEKEGHRTAWIVLGLAAGGGAAGVAAALASGGGHRTVSPSTP
jgi:ferric-dicitrate binding protein FerR (iron transport regulator)